jgi:hypothetical protein
LLLTLTTCAAAAAAAAAAARYGRMAASDKEIEEVADAACIHDPITTRFPKVRAGVIRLCKINTLSVLHHDTPLQDSLAIASLC